MTDSNHIIDPCIGHGCSQGIETTLFLKLEVDAKVLMQRIEKKSETDQKHIFLQNPSLTWNQVKRLDIFIGAGDAPDQLKHCVAGQQTPLHTSLRCRCSIGKAFVEFSLKLAICV